MIRHSLTLIAGAAPATDTSARLQAIIDSAEALAEDLSKMGETEAAEDVDCLAMDAIYLITQLSTELSAHRIERAGLRLL